MQQEQSTTNFVCPSFGAFEVAPQPWYQKLKSILKGREVTAPPSNLKIANARRRTFVVPTEGKRKNPNPQGKEGSPQSPDGGQSPNNASSRKAVRVRSATRSPTPERTSTSDPVYLPEAQDTFSDVDDDTVHLDMCAFQASPVKRAPLNGSWRQRVQQPISVKVHPNPEPSLPRARPTFLMPNTFISTDDLFRLSTGDPVLDNMQEKAVSHLQCMARTIIRDEHREVWGEILCRLAWTCAQRVNPKNVHSMDVMSCVRIMNVPVGDTSECEYVPGIAFRKHAADARMAKTIHNGRILLLGGSVDINRQGHVVDLEESTLTEVRNCEVLFNIICQWKPDVVLVEQNMHHRIISNLFLQGTTVATYVKRVILDKISATTGAMIINLDSALAEITVRGFEHLVAEMNPSGQFKLFHAYSAMRPPLMYLVPKEEKDKSRYVVQATMVLRGAPIETLRVMKKYLSFLAHTAYNLLLEAHVYQDFQLQLPSCTEASSGDKDGDKDESPITSSMHGCQVVFPPAQLLPETHWEQFTGHGAVDPMCHQSIILHRTRCLSGAAEVEEEKPQSPHGQLGTQGCMANVEFQLCSVTFYDRSKNDVTLVEALSEWLNQAVEEKGPKLKVIHYAHHRGVVSVQTVIMEEKVPPNVISVWTVCNVCKIASAKTVLSLWTQRYSFGKFLENFFYNTVGTTPCGHKYFSQNTLHFAKSMDIPSLPTVVVVMQYREQRTLSITRPPKILPDSIFPEKVFRDEVVELGEVTCEAFKGVRKIFDEMLAAKASAFLVYTPQVEERVSQLQSMIAGKIMLSLERETTFTGKLLDATESKDFLAFNHYRRALYDELREWTKHIGEVWSIYLAPELQSRAPNRTMGEADGDAPASLAFTSQAFGAVSEVQDVLRSRLTSTSSKKTGKFSAPLVQFPDRLSNGQTHMCCGIGVNGVLIVVRDHEPTSMIAFALNSVEYQRFTGMDPAQAPPEATPRQFSIETTSRQFSSEDIVPRDNDFDVDERHFDADAREGVLPPPPQKPTAPIGTCTPEQLRQCYDNLCERKRFNFELKFENRDENGATFMCTVYYAKQFAALRMLYCSSEECAFLTSLSRSMPYFPSGGKSGSAFVKTRDDRYILKQVSQVEMKHFLETFAPEYFMHMCRFYFGHYESSLVKTLGVYKLSVRSKTRGSSSAYYILMENLFYGRSITRAFDLKGSLRNRLQPKIGAVLLDENLLGAIENQKWVYIKEWDKEKLNLSVYNDTLLLSLQRIMDYSLLVGVDEASQTVVVGIVDYFREYDLKKQLESGWKSGIAGGKQPTIINPKHYKKRFRMAMKNYFPLLPDKLTPWVIKMSELYSLVEKVED